MAYMDEEARKRKALMDADGDNDGSVAGEVEAQEYVDSESMRNKPKSAGRKATQAEEQQYVMAVKQALEFLFQPETSATLVQTAQQSDPANAIAAIAVQIIEGIGSAAANSGVELSDELLLAVGYQVAVAAAGLLASQGVVEQSEESIMMLAENAVSIGREMVMQARG